MPKKTESSLLTDAFPKVPNRSSSMIAEQYTRCLIEISADQTRAVALCATNA